MAAAIYISIFGFIVGILFETFSNAGIFLLLFFLIIVVGLAAGGIFFLEAARSSASGFFENSLLSAQAGRSNSSQNPDAASSAKKYAFLPLVLLFLVFSFLGALRYETYAKTPDPILSSAQGKVSLVGVIAGDPDVRTNKVFLTVRIESIDGQKVSGENNVLVQTSLFSDHSYGEEIGLYGILLPPRNFSDDATGETFDYASYLRKDRIYFVMDDPRVNVFSRNKGNPIMAVLFSVKHAFVESIGRNIHEPNASLVAAALLGERHSVPQDILDMLRRVGVIHIVILSGYAITIVADSVRKFFSRFGFRTSLVLASLSIILFAVMTGASAMVVRSSVMALFAFLSRAVSRKHDIVRALAFTVFLMIFWNPLILVFDVSFQVSILAVAGLVFISPLLEKKIKSETVVSTLAAQIAVLPYLLYVTGSLSLFSIPANLLVLPVLPMTMLFGMLSGAVGFVSPILAFPFSAIAYALTSYELFAAKLFSALPFSSVSLPVPFWLVALVYVFYAFALLKFSSMTSQLRLAKKSST